MSREPFDDPQTFQIIGAAMAVHRELGCGFLEKVYQAALRIEFERHQVPFEPEVLLPISYQGRPLALRYYVDFICFGNVLVEVKALKSIGDLEAAQLINYLKAAKIRRGLVLNFGSTSLQHKRLVFG